MNIKWTFAEMRFIRENAHLYSDKQMAIMLSEFSGREIKQDALRKKRSRMGIHKVHGRGRVEVDHKAKTKPLGKHWI